jgi:RNA polymerase sigma-70 factor (ECF subfamily)
LENLTQIIDLCKQQVPSAQEVVFNKYSRVLLGVCCRYIKDRDDAEDVLQDSFMKIFSNIQQLKSEDSFEGWMKRITVNTALRFIKEKQKVRFENVDNMRISDESTEEEDLLEEDIKAERILECIKELPDGYRTIFNMYTVDGFSHKEIADKLNIKEGTSRSQYLKARRFLMELLKKKQIKSTNEWMKIAGITTTLFVVSWILLA